MPAPNALPKNLVNRLAYCDECTTPIAFGHGGFPESMNFAHVDRVTGKKHPGKMIEIPADERIEKGEVYQNFLARMLVKYVTNKS